jgi:hypothetical protein
VQLVAQMFCVGVPVVLPSVIVSGDAPAVPA